MRRAFLILNLLIYGSTISQNASNYVPADIGNVWVMNNYVLDSAGTPIGQPQVTIDSSIAYQSFLGKQTLFILRKPSGVDVGDTLWIAPSNQSIFIHQKDFDFDTLVTIRFPDWFEYYRFSTPLGTFYTIYRFDTTLTVPELGTLPLRFLLHGARFGNDTVTVPAGFFNAVKFRIELKVQYLVVLPPPFPPLAIDLVTIPINDWLAEGRFIVKSLQEPFTIDTLNITLPGSLRELVEFRNVTLVEKKENPVKSFVLNQNYPNPFNGTTVISFRLEEKERVIISIYDCLGRKITDLLDGELSPGEHSIEFIADNYGLTSGFYFYQLKNKTKIETKGMIYLK